jgi:hypothetical protein
MRKRPSPLALLLLVLAAGLPGCFVGEIDKSMKEYDQTRAAPGPAPAPGAAAKSPAPGTPPGQPATPSGPSWWQTAKTLGSDPIDEDIAGCALGGRIEFMLRDDCLARGGRPQ